MKKLFRFNIKTQWYDLEAKSFIFIQLNIGKVKISSRSSMDSDLEAFSHNPADGSFAPLSFRIGAWTNYPNQRFLSY